MSTIRVKFRCKVHDLDLHGWPDWLVVDDTYVASWGGMWCPSKSAEFMAREHCDENNWVMDLVDVS